MIASVLREYTSRFLNMIYPKRCIACGEFLSHDDTRFACISCWKKIEVIKPLSCRMCSRPLDYGGEYCPECRNKVFPYQALYSTLKYGDIIREYLHRIKFGKRAYLLKPLECFLFDVFERNKLMLSADALIPVPLHPVRFRERGFNQSEILCDAISGKYNIRVLKDILVRKKNTLPQFDLSKSERHTNIADAFYISPVKKMLLPRTIVLVDDICTTGATFRECALTLKKSGVKNITCLSLARD